MVNAVGRDFDDQPHEWSADVVERSAIRRWLEPLEFDCALHYDPEAARAHGYVDILVPVAALPTFSLPPMWRPGETLFTSADRDAQPPSPLRGLQAGLEPPTTGFIVTDLEYEYLRPVVVGDRLSRRGARLLSCTPKETSVGRGAFIVWSTNIINQHGEVVACTQTNYFRYNPHSRP